MNLLEGGKGREGRVGERGWGGDVGERGRVGEGSGGRGAGRDYCSAVILRNYVTRCSTI